MKRIPSIKAVMTPFPYCIDVEQSLEEAARMMEEHDIRHLPASRNKEPVGVVWESDVRWALELANSSETREPILVEQICDLGAHRVDLSERLDNVLMQMARERTLATLVFKQDRLVGIFTSTDAFRAFAEYLRAEFSAGGGDDAA